MFLSANALAQQWPQKPVKVVVPFPPGGVTDSLARITADWLTPRLGQPVIAENRPGASGAIAAEFVARADADGYTLFSAATPQLAIVPHVQKVSYDPLKDFAPISIVGTNPFALGCNEKLPPKSLAEFVAYAKERPGQLSFASPGSGSVGHLTMALFLARAGLKMEAVLYKGGGPAMADVVAGHVPCYFGNLNEIIPHAGGGRIKVFAVSGERRAPQLPQVPTVAEQGYPGFRTVTWNGYVAPAGDAARDRRAHRARDRRRLQGRRVRRAAEQDRRRPGVQHAGRVLAGDPRGPGDLEGSRAGGGNEMKVAIPDLISPSYFPRDRGGRARLLQEGRHRRHARAALPGDQDLRGPARRQARLRRRRLACGALCVQGLAGREAALRAGAAHVLVFGRSFRI